MKKFPIVLCAIFALPAAFGAGGALTAAAAEEPVLLTDEEMQLLLPDRFEQYLPFDEAAYVAAQGERVAIAGGSTVYAYDGQTYAAYTAHEAQICNLQFGEDGTLYCLDVSGELFALHCDEQPFTERDLTVHCSAFTLGRGDEIYYSQTVTGNTTLFLQTAGETKEIDRFSQAPAICFDDGKLYYSSASILYQRVGTTRREYDAGITVTGVAAYGDQVYYTDGNDLYFYDWANGETRQYASEEYAYTSVSAGENGLYVVCKRESGVDIRLLNISTGEFSDYVITSSSTAQNRLAQATAATRAGKRLAVADKERLVVCGENGVTSFPTAFTPQFIASNGKSVFVADSTRVAAYDFAGNLLFGVASVGEYGAVNGVTSDGTDYFAVTANNSFLRLNGNDFAVEEHKKTLSYFADDLASDVYGNLYVLDNASHNVYRYTQAEFLSANGVTEAYCSLPARVKNLTVDFGGKVYGRTEEKAESGFYEVLCSDGARYAVTPPARLYGANGNLQAFTLSFTDDTVHFIFDDFILKTDALPVSNVNEMETGDAYEKIFAQANGARLTPFVKIAENTLAFTFAAEQLTENSAVFPDCAYLRINAEQTAVVLCETQIQGKDYYVAAVYDQAAQTQTACLVLKEDCTLLSEEEYAAAPTGFGGGTGYITNDVNLYKYPFFADEVTLFCLPKNTAVRVLDRLYADNLSCPYLHVAVENEAGKVTYGYLPESYVRATRATDAPAVTYSPETPPAKDRTRVFLIVLLLLAAAIIAVNYVVFRLSEKRKND